MHTNIYSGYCFKGYVTILFFDVFFFDQKRFVVLYVSCSIFHVPCSKFSVQFLVFPLSYFLFCVPCSVFLKIVGSSKSELSCCHNTYGRRDCYCRMLGCFYHSMRERRDCCCTPSCLLLPRICWTGDSSSSGWSAQHLQLLGQDLQDQEL